MYSFAVWLRDDSPGPIFTDGKLCISAMSDVVGDTNGHSPKFTVASTNGWLSGITEAHTLVERGVMSQFTLLAIILAVSSLVYASVVRTSAVKRQISGIILC